MSLLKGASPSFKRNTDSEVDPYSPSIVEDLLQGTSEWRNVQDIVRLTFKALTDVVKAQGEAIKELEKQIPTRASKTELNNGLSMKANISDVSRTIADVSATLENKPNMDDLETILKDYPCKSELQYILAKKVGIEELQGLMDNKVTIHDVRGEIDDVNGKMEEFIREANRKLSHCAHSKEITSIYEILESKANLVEINEALDNKANKQSVANALHRKVNKSDVESMLARKCDLVYSLIIQNELQSLLGALESKAELSLVDKLNSQIENKVDRNEFKSLLTAISTKADNIEVELLKDNIANLESSKDSRMNSLINNVSELKNNVHSILDELNDISIKKADNKDVDKICKEISKKVEKDSIEDILAQMKDELYNDILLLKDDILSERQAQVQHIQEKESNIELFQDKFNDDIIQLTEHLKALSEERRNDVEETAKFIKNVVNNTKNELIKELEKYGEDYETLISNVEDIFSRKIDKKDFLEIRAKLVAQIDEKVDLFEVQNAINSIQSDFSNKFIEHRDELLLEIKNHENNVLEMISKKANLSEMSSALSSKADMSALQSVSNHKVNANEFDDLKKLTEKLLKEFEDKVSIKLFEKHIGNQKKESEHINKELLLKANIKDICMLLDAKANIEDVNKALTDVHHTLEGKSNVDDMNSIVNDQAAINESLCTENIVGRWTWRSGDIKNGNLIPWEGQVINTLPDNFLWEKDKSSILIVAPGLYEINFAFFGKKKPTVQLLLNGEVLYSAANSNTYAVHHSSGKLKEQRHSAGNVTGISMIDYLSLPARARISFTFIGEKGCDGFFSLKRL